MESREGQKQGVKNPHKSLNIKFLILSFVRYNS